MTSTLVSVLSHPDEARLEALLSEDVCFHSPVADYVTRADIAHLFIKIAGIIESMEPVRELASARERTTFLSGSVRGQHIEGVLDERYDTGGRVFEVTLMLRPLAALNTAVLAMAEALAVSPLPSRAPLAPR